MKFKQEIINKLTAYQSKSLKAFCDNNFIVSNAAIDLGTTTSNASTSIRRAEMRLPRDFFIISDETKAQRLRYVTGVNEAYIES